MRVVIEEVGDWLKVNFPYDADAVATLKEAVPGFDRKWDAESKTWMVRGEWGNDLTEAMMARGHTVAGVASSPPPDANAFWGAAPAAVPRWSPPAATTAGPPPTPADDDAPSDFWKTTRAEERAWCKAKAQEIIDSTPENLRHRVLREFAKRLYPDMYERR